MSDETKWCDKCGFRADGDGSQKCAYPQCPVPKYRDTPDPRDRGEDAWTIVRKALLDACAVDRNPLHKYEHVSARLDAIAAQCADRVLALRAPAPSEAVAVCTGCGANRVTAIIAVLQGNAACCPECSTLGVWERNAIREAMDTHPAPARGVTEEEREVMGDIALDGFIDWCDLDPTDENRSASALARQYLALRQKSRTPDAEGGA